MRLVDPAALADFVARLFLAAGCSAAEAEAVATGLVEANLVGHDSHGVLRVPTYLTQLDDGTMQRGAAPRVEGKSGAVVTLDGQRCLGHVAGRSAVEHGVAMARAFGGAIVALRNSGHLGRIGRWAELAAAAGLVSLHFVNTSGGSAADVLLVAPFGGRDRRMSVNPLCIGLPRPGLPPLVLDATVAATAGGKVMAALNRGDRLPPGQIQDRDGRPSTDPRDLFEGGAILPFGDHRGHALAFMIDVLAGALTGGGCSASPRHPWMNNMASIYVDPGRVAGALFAADLEAFAGWVAAAPPAVEGGAVLLPGDIERRTAEARRRDGIPLDDTTLGQLQAAAQARRVAPLAL